MDKIYGLAAAAPEGVVVDGIMVVIGGFGLGILLRTRQIRKTISLCVGENAEFTHQYLSGELELECNPQATLAELMRAEGLGIARFLYQDRCRLGDRSRQGTQRFWDRGALLCRLLRSIG